MKRAITFKIEGYDKQFTVKELTLQEIIGLLQGDAFEGKQLSDLQRVFTDDFLPLSANVTSQELMEMVPSEIKEIWDKFMEVNSVFFGIARKMGVLDMFSGLKEAMASDFFNLLANSSKPGIQKS